MTELAVDGAPRKLHRKGVPLSLSQKLDLIRAVEGGQKTKTALASEFGLAKSSVSDIWRQKDKLIEACTSGEYAPHRKRMRKSMYTDVEEALLLWLRQSLVYNEPISGPIVQKKAKEFADTLGHSQFSCSSGWLARFKARHMISFKNNTCQIGTSSGELINNKWVGAQLPSSLSEFPLDSIYVAHVYGLYWKCLPKEISDYSQETCAGGERPEDRLTVLLCANMMGSEKLPLLVVGSSHAPSICFRRCNHDLVLYERDRMSWMNPSAFTTWLKGMDVHFAKSRRKVALLVDHSVMDSVDRLGLEAIRLVYLPPTSVLQASGKAMVCSLKCHYRRYLIVDMLAAVDRGEQHNLKLLDSLFLLDAAWRQVSPGTIERGFQRCGFSQGSASDDGAPVDEGEAAIRDGAMLLQRIGISDVSFEDYLSVDKDLSTARQAVGGSQEDAAEEQTPPGLLPLAELGQQLDLREVDQSLKVLRRFFLAIGDEGDGAELVARLGHMTSEAIIKSVNHPHHQD